MSIFKKNRDEDYFYKYLMDLSPKEMVAFQKAVIRYMSYITGLFKDVESLKQKNNKERKEVQ